MDSKQAIRSLASIAHEARLALLRKLIQAGPDGLTAGALAEFAEAGLTTVSAQLQVLAQADLVVASRQGRNVVYRANYEVMRDLLCFLMLDCCAGEERICEPVARACCP